MIFAFYSVNINCSEVEYIMYNIGIGTAVLYL